MSDHKWQGIANSIEASIREERLRPGDRIPSERELSVEWGVSRMTVHRGLQELQRGGWVVRRRRHGTVVAGPDARRSRRLAMVYFSDATVLESAYLSGVRSAIPEEIDLLICVHRDEPKREARIIGRLAEEVDGIILIGTGAPENDALIQRAAGNGLAMACIDRVSPGLQVDSVVTDNYGASLEALRRLVERGHTRIAHFTADILHVSSARERYEAYVEACREAGVCVEPR
ncbi:MAG: GntR family transcriptional regulator, partial [Armatimonadetes bacterium]|nr:GntR family transcriptional regulator [Armatimonadota bacterium]